MAVYGWVACCHLILVLVYQLFRLVRFTSFGSHATFVGILIHEGVVLEKIENCIVGGEGRVIYSEGDEFKSASTRGFF